MNLTDVTFDASSDPLVATFTWTGQVPRRDAVRWQIKLTNGDKEAIRYLGYKIVDGKHSAQFVYGFGGCMASQPNTGRGTGGNRLTVWFNSLAMTNMGVDWTWQALLTIDGKDVAAFQP
jgi:hypothetical protein